MLSVASGLFFKQLTVVELFISYSVGLFLVGFTLQFLGNAWTISILFLLLAIFTLATFWNKNLLS